MLITFVDTSTSPATAALPTYHYIDTSAGLLQFVSAGAGTIGSIKFAGTAFFTPASQALWLFLQQQVTIALLNGVTSLSFITTNAPTVTGVAASGSWGAGFTLTLSGTGFQNNMTISLESSTTHVVIPLGTAIVNSAVSATVTTPILTIDTYNLTLLNPDNSYAYYAAALNP